MDQDVIIKMRQKFQNELSKLINVISTEILSLQCSAVYCMHPHWSSDRHLAAQVQIQDPDSKRRSRTLAA